jgi:hypothetical protein
MVSMLMVLGRPIWLVTDKIGPVFIFQELLVKRSRPVERIAVDLICR